MRVSFAIPRYFAADGDPRNGSGQRYSIAGLHALTACASSLHALFGGGCNWSCRRLTWRG